MHLSRLILDPRPREVRRDLADCHDLHRTIMSVFPHLEGDGEAARERLGVLFRVEPSPRAGGPPVVLVQSNVLPDWTRLPMGYLLGPGDSRDNPACRSVEERYQALALGTRLRFRLRANPTKKIDTRSGPNGEQRNGRRIPLAGDDERLGWLARKAATGGFRVLTVRERAEVPDARTSNLEKIAGWREGPDHTGQLATRKLTFASVLFDGYLEVTDAARFFETLRQGIGPAKAYGFGLLSIARPGE
jgi:CRISPR system Cascade subunit CasE